MAVIDSGVNPEHAHIGRIAGGVAFDSDGSEHPDWVDRLGHGTAVAAAIQEKAPDAALLAVRVFERSLATSAAVLVRALDWAAAQQRFDAVAQGTLYIHVKYAIRGTNDPRNLVFPFYVIPSHDRADSAGGGL